MKGFIHAAALFGILLNYRGKANGIVNSFKVPSLTFPTNYSWWRKPITFLLMLPSLLFCSTIGVGIPTFWLVEKAYCFLTAAALFAIFFNYRGEAQHIGIPILLLLEKAYGFLATTALFSIFFNYRGCVQHIGIYFKRPL